MSRVDSSRSNWARAMCARSHALLATVLFLALPHLALAQLAASPAAANQLAAPGNAAANPLNVFNSDSTMSHDVLWVIASDTTGGATLAGAGDLDNAPNEWATTIPIGQSSGPTLTLGPNEGEVQVFFCDAIQGGPGDYICASVPPPPSFVGRTATLQAASITSEFVDPGQTNNMARAQGINGGVVDGSTIPVSFTLVGPGSPPSGNAISTAANAAEFPFQVDPSAPPGSVITITATRTDVPNVPPVMFTYTVNDYQLLQISPPDGTVVLAGSTINLVVRLLANGDGLMDNNINFAFVSNPNGSTLLNANDTTAFDGSARTTLTMGAPNPGSPPPNVVVRAFYRQGDAVLERTVDFVITPDDAIAFDAASVSGNNQSAAVNTAFAQPLSLRFLRNGAADVGSTIDWTVNPPTAATLNSASTTTGINGGTSNTVTAGSTGGNFTVTATHRDDPSISFTYALLALDKRLIKPSTGSGDGQTGSINQTLSQPLVAVATVNGAPEANVTVNWSVLSGSATIVETNPTDGSGRSFAQVTFGSTAGPVTIQAERADAPGQLQTYTVTAVDTRALAKPPTGSGDGQTGAVNQTLPQPLVAVATINGATESGVTVNWTVLSGSATVVPTNPTDNNGRSFAQVTFGSTPGPVTIQAERADAPGQLQTYTVTATDTRTLVKPPTGSGDGQAVRPGEASQPLIVAALNNGVLTPGVVVQWSVTGNAVPSATQTTTGPDGKTSIFVTFGPNATNVTVTAVRQDEPTATASFVLTAASENLTLEVASGDGASGAPGSQLNISAVARRNGSGDPNILIFFDVLSGSATLGRDSVNTNSSGLATTTVVLGAPGPIQIRATRTDNGVSVIFRLTSVATDTGDVLTIVGGNNQVAAPGATGTPLSVRFTRNGVPTSAVNVSWNVTSGSATLSSNTTTTTTDGASQVGITFGTTPGPVTVTATAGTASVTFTLSVQSTTPGLTLRVVSGSGQTGPIGTRAAAPIVLEVVNSNGVPSPAQTLEWSVVSGSATLDFPTTTTGADGRTSQGFRFGTTAGAIVIRARIPGAATPLQVDVPATSFVPTLTIVSGNNQTGPVSTLLPQDLVVGISGPSGVSLTGVTIRWQVASGGGQLASATEITNAAGRASNHWTLGPNAGANTVTASIDGGGSVTFSATGVVAGGVLIIVSGNGQTIPTATPSAPLAVELETAAGQPVPGATLDWSATNATFVGGTVTTVTDEQGRSSNAVRVTMPGAATVTVKVRGQSLQVTFGISGGVANVPTLGQPEENVANAIDILCPVLASTSNPTPEQADLLARCLELVNNAGDHPDQVETALGELQQDTALAQANAALLSASTQFDNLKARIAALRSGTQGADFGGLAVATSTGTIPLSFLPSSVVQDEGADEGGGTAEVDGEIGSDFSRWGFFASGIIGRGKQDQRSVTPEYDFDTTGLTAGVDYRVNDAFIVGVSLGYNQQDTELSDDNGKIDTKGWSLSGYTTWYRQNNWYLDGVLTYGSNDYDLDRSIAYDIVGAGGALTHVNQRARASTGGDQLSLALSVGRDFQKGPWSFGPYMRGTYTRVEFDSYEERLETGPGSGLGLAVEARELESMTAVAGGKVTYAMSRDWGILMPHAQIEWEHEFEDDPQELVTRFLNDPTGTRIRLNGDEVDTDYFNIGFGLSALFPGGRSAFFYYEHLAGSEGLSQDHLSLGVRIEF